MVERPVQLIRDLLPVRRGPGDIDSALKEAVAWIHRAQDSGEDRGVSHSYLLGRGWSPSYPETTGYIIPTLLNWALVTGDIESQVRALEMCDWECRVQGADGSIHGGVIQEGKVPPVVFNTGQVVFGWVGGFRATGEVRYLRAAERAVSWLLDMLGNNPTWQTHGSMGAEKAHTYNVRVAWSILEYSRLVGNRHHERIRQILPWFLSQQRENGWFERNCLNDDQRPLLHTIGYAARGLLECGVILEDDACVHAAERAAAALCAALQQSGRMPGRLDGNWQPQCKWSCLTGIAQMSIVWRKLGRLVATDRFLECADRANRYLRTVQDVRTANLGVRGGISGSHPINGDYGRYRYLNWAAKFFVDANLLEAYPETSLTAEQYAG